MITAAKLRRALDVEVYEASLAEAGRTMYFLARRGGQKLVGRIGEGEADGRAAMLGPTDAANAAAVRAALPWTAPKLIGHAASVGLGDRLGLATPGHLRAVRGTGLKAVVAQQSIREMTRTGRSPQDVMDDATWGVFQEGYRDGFGSDADHLQTPVDIDATAAAGFTMFTIDPGAFVENHADDMPPQQLRARYDELDFETLETRGDELAGRYQDKTFDLAGGGRAAFPDSAFHRAAVKYGQAVAHTVKMFRHLRGRVAGPVEVEISVDETDSPTSAAEHYFVAAELKRLGVEWVSLAPRFVGRFEKGVDYIGDLDTFRASFARHVAVMRTLGPYKLSVHSGSDKFSIYPVVAELTDGLVHVKTAGTSYLEALRVLASANAGFFREVLDFARGRYETDRATYHVSADLDRVPAAGTLADDDLPALLDDFHARQVLHVTYGSVLTADEGERFAAPLREALESDEEAHYAALEHHLGRHVAPFTKP